MATDDITILCNQRATWLANRTPQVRFELTNPYLGTNLTAKQLDMRRKAEILKYSGPRSANQSNKMTKKINLAYALSGRLSKISATQIDACGNFLNCADQQGKPMPTTNSGIPGPVEYIYLDSAVPLYNYITDRTYPSDQILESEFWSVEANADRLVPFNTETSIFTIHIKDNIDSPNYRFSFRTPFAVCCSGNIINNGFAKINPITVSVNYLAVVVLFSGTVVQTKVFTPAISDLVFDVSGSVGPFVATQYVGYLTVSGLELITSPGYHYDVQVLARYTISGQGTSYFSSVNAYGFANVSTLNNVVSNCNIRSTTSTVPNVGFVLSGV
jgi:hypothetical protein